MSSGFLPGDFFIAWYYDGFGFLCLFPVGGVGEVEKMKSESGDFVFASGGSGGPD